MHLQIQSQESKKYKYEFGPGDSINLNLGLNREDLTLDAEPLSSWPFSVKFGEVRDLNSL
jgi:hypothetical protein